MKKNEIIELLTFEPLVICYVIFGCMMAILGTMCLYEIVSRMTFSLTIGW